METKKNSKANLEKTRSLFFLTGLIVAVSLMIFAFNKDVRQQFSSIDVNNTYTDTEMLPSTKADVPENKPDKLTKPEPQKIVTDLIKIVDDTTKIKNVLPIWTDGDTVIYKKLDPPVTQNDEPWVYVGEMPKFPGGDRALIKYIADHTKYPALAIENGIKGTVNMKFEIKKTGEIGRVEIIRGTHPILDEEAVRVIKALPKFKPGKQNGVPVNVWLTIPVRFNLE